METAESNLGMAPRHCVHEETLYSAASWMSIEFLDHTGSRGEFSNSRRPLGCLGAPGEFLDSTGAFMEDSLPDYGA